MGALKFRHRKTAKCEYIHLADIILENRAVNGLFQFDGDCYLTVNNVNITKMGFAVEAWLYQTHAL